MIAYAWVAHHRRDWPEALKRWDAVVTRFPALADGRLGAARVLQELGRLGDAANVLNPALRMYPDDRHVAIAAGWLATRRRDMPEADRIWTEVRARFPDETAGWVAWASALTAVGRLEEAETVLLDAATRFPEDPSVAFEFARLPEQKQAWDVAVERWRDVFARFPGLTRSHAGLGDVLIASGRAEEGNAVLEAAIGRFPDELDLAVAYARAADRLRDWTEAERRWAQVVGRFPARVAAHVGLGGALLGAGQFDRAMEYLEGALRQFPNDVELEIQLALTLSRKRDWPAALRLWESLKRRHPGHPGIRSSLSGVLWQARQDQGASLADGTVPFEIPELLLSNDVDEGEDVRALGAMFMQFESIGDTCEFGIVQRRFGAEPISLLRWGSISPDHLVQALDTQFEGVGEPEHTIVAESHGEYTTRDRRYHMFTHTFTPVSSEPLERFAPQQCRRMQYLRRKLVDDLTNAAKVFVYKSERGVTGEQFRALQDALLRYSEDIALLCVRLADASHPPGTLERVGGRFFVGYIERFSTVDIAVDTWVSLCKQTLAQLSA